MNTITISEAVKLKAYVWEHFKVNLHIHDTCGGGLFFTLEEVNEEVTKFVLAYFYARGIETDVSKDMKAIFLGERSKKDKRKLNYVYEADKLRAAAYDGKTCVAECNYIVREGRWIIEHTYVEAPYRNQKIARELVLLILEESRKAGVELTAQCLYAKRILEPFI